MDTLSGDALSIENTFLLDPRHDNFLHGTPGQLYGFNLRWLLAIFIGGVIVGGIILASAVLTIRAEMNVTTALEQHGVTTQAKILDLYSIDRTDRNGGKTGTNYYVTYQFQHQEQFHTINIKVSHTTYEPLIEGDMLTVRYLPENPTISRIPGDHPADPMAFLVWGFGFLFGGCVAGFLGWRNRRRKRTLEQHGQLLPGLITQSSGRMASKKGYLIELKYRFSTPNGSIIEQKTSGIRNDLWQKPLPPKGHQIAVLYVDEHLYMVL